MTPFQALGRPMEKQAFGALTRAGGALAKNWKPAAATGVGVTGGIGAANTLGVPLDETFANKRQQRAEAASDPAAQLKHYQVLMDRLQRRDSPFRPFDDNVRSLLNYDDTDKQLEGISTRMREIQAANPELINGGNPLGRP